MTSVAIFDLDGTIDRSDTFVPFLIGLLLRSPRRWWRTPQLGWAMLMHYGFTVRDNAWLKAYFLTHLVGGRQPEAIASYVHAFVARRVEKYVEPRIVARIEHHASKGDKLVLATASPDLYAPLFGEKLGFSHTICTEVQTDERGRWTGVLAMGNCYGPVKYERISAFLSATDSQWSDVIFYSDHHSDAPVFKAAAESYAVNPTSKLVSMLPELGVPILD